MRKMRTVPRLSAAGMSKPKIAASLGVSATAASQYIRTQPIRTTPSVTKTFLPLATEKATRSLMPKAKGPLSDRPFSTLRPFSPRSMSGGPRTSLDAKISA
jgi:hypothetical protein